jgi:CTP synthase
VTDAIQDWIERVAMVSISGDDQPPDICVIELGGTIGDIEGMPFVEAFRQFQFRVGLENFCNIHVSLVPQPSATGEQKTKPTQNSVRQLRGLGLSPDLIVCRSQKPIGQSVKSKISNFCHVKASQVVAVHDCSSIYRVPLLLQEQGVLEFFLKRLEIQVVQTRPSYLHKWRNLAERHDSLQQEVKIALVGKYTKLEDAYISVIKALQHAAFSCRHKLALIKVESDDLEEDCLSHEPIKYHDAWKAVCSADGILVPGGFGRRGTEGKIKAVKYAREKKIPYLGVCLGLQMAVIEFSRTVLGWTDAQSTEFDKDTTHPVVIEMPEHNPGQMGATMRLGKRKTIFTDKSCTIKKLYGNKAYVEERHRHRYEVNPKYVMDLEEKGLKFVGSSTDNQRMEILELADHPYFVAVQFHPEYLTRPMFPSPPFLGLIMAACGKLEAFISRNCQLSPRASYEYDSEEDDEVTQALHSRDSKSPASTLPKITTVAPQD